MKLLLLFNGAFLFIAAIVNAQNSSDFPLWNGRWTERQSERGAIEWMFQGKNFAKINYWGRFEVEGRIHKGTFKIDTVNKLVLLKFNKVVMIEEDTVVSTGYHEEWNIISTDKNELVLSRKILFSTDIPNKEGDKEHVYVRLKRTTKYPTYEPTVVTK